MKRFFSLGIKNESRKTQKFPSFPFEGTSTPKMIKIGEIRVLYTLSWKAPAETLFTAFEALFLGFSEPFQAPSETDWMDV